MMEVRNNDKMEIYMLLNNKTVIHNGYNGIPMKRSCDFFCIDDHSNNLSIRFFHYFVIVRVGIIITITISIISNRCSITIIITTTLLTTLYVCSPVS